MNIVINKCFGGFSISLECAKRMADLGDKRATAEVNEWEQDNKYIKEFIETGKWNNSLDKDDIWNLSLDAKYLGEKKFYGYGYVDGFEGGYERNNEILARVVKELGNLANGEHANLEVVEIPDDVDYYIDEYDGIESIHENHRSW